MKGYRDKNNIKSLFAHQNKKKIDTTFLNFRTLSWILNDSAHHQSTILFVLYLYFLFKGHDKTQEKPNWILTCCFLKLIHIIIALCLGNASVISFMSRYGMVYLGEKAWHSSTVMKALDQHHQVRESGFLMRYTYYCSADCSKA